MSIDRALVNQSQGDSLYPLHYLGHNIHFLAWTLSIEGRRDESLNMAEELVKNTRAFSTDDLTNDNNTRMALMALITIEFSVALLVSAEPDLTRIHVVARRPPAPGARPGPPGDR